MENTSELRTKARLLEAARQIFASKGLAGATVRDICALAKANVAAVNYHFGGKEKLYLAVLMEYMRTQDQRHPLDAGMTAQSPPELRLREYVRGMLRHFLGDGDPVNEGLGRLLTQEFVEPTQHFSQIYDSHCRQQNELLLDIVRRLLPGAPEALVERCASSIIGQCVLLDFAKDALRIMRPQLALTPDNADAVADTIVEFSLGGILRLKSCMEKGRAA